MANNNEAFDLSNINQKTPFKIINKPRELEAR
jgi:hypothetical protein